MFIESQAIINKKNTWVYADRILSDKVSEIWAKKKIHSKLTEVYRTLGHLETEGKSRKSNETYRDFVAENNCLRRWLSYIPVAENERSRVFLSPKTMET